MGAKIQQLLSLPSMVNGMIKTSSVNNAVNTFDSNSGVRHYTSLIYRWAAFLGWVAMEYTILKAAYDYFTGEKPGGLALLGSALTTVLLLASAFPIAHLIRSRGESLGTGHQGMTSFIFGDFIKTNILLVGEIAAIIALFGAFHQTLSFLFQKTLIPFTSIDLLGTLSSVSAIPMELLDGLLNWFNIDMDLSFLNSATWGLTESSGTYDNGFKWNGEDFFGVLASYVNVIIGLAFVYVSLAIYGFLYKMTTTLLNWILSPSIPISLRNR